MILEDLTIEKAQRNTKIHFTLNVFHGLQLRINKPLLMMKFALFLWFAGAFGALAFFFLFLRQRGLSIAHLSLAMTTSAIFQFLGSSLSGVIADKIGRAKPVLYAHLLITIIMSTTLILMPQITSGSVKHHFEFLNNTSNNISRLVSDAWCNPSDTIIEQKSCKIYFSTNLSYSPTDHCLLVTNIENETFSQMNFNGNRTEILEITELCCQDIATRDESFTFCNSTFCKQLKNECICEKRVCLNSNNRRILLLSSYTLLISLYYLSVSSVYHFYDLTVKRLVEEHHADFGRQRLFSILGTLIGPSLIGYILQLTSSSNDKNYYLALVFLNIFTVLSSLAIWNIDVPEMDPGQKMFKKAIKLMKKPDIIPFVIVLFVLGTNFNFMVLFSNLYLEELGASKLLLGLFIPLSSVSSLVLLFTSKWWLQNFGEHNIFILALLGYGLFGISFSFLREPWFAVLFGAIAFTFSYHLLWVAVVHYAHTIAPDGLYASVIVVVGGLHFSASRIAASLIGGMIMNAFGGRIAFRVMGTGSLITAALYGSFYYFRRFCLQKM